ncbi:SMI1/KNR4 family protein [Dinghuibacter silviterrae]|uniref:SMI1/KNR4 family protein SUKH-1 n=1 Tax=Dinghuibacter silviterrae TaxID=1539049 RepID=A0A4R8DWL5_9BACT|nr:SMI1/KNR4 family protein [Dinghuibacter silviterrae]TDX02328.1 SMI1/KNR4 family protein SUKH-1 [Dinghuibacter silviterrae]
MTPLEQLKALLNERYVTEDENEYQVVLSEGLTDEQIDRLAAQLPQSRIPPDIRELLQFAAGFEFDPVEQVTFDGVGQFGLENIFPHSVQLAGDGYGNFWILDVDKEGEWGNVFFVGHDPAVVVKQSENLTEFIQHLDEFGKKGPASNLDRVHEEICPRIFHKEDGFIDVVPARASGDPVLKAFATGLPDHFVIADLRGKPNHSGFAWGKYGPHIEHAVRHEHELLWGFEKKGGIFKRFR